MEEIEGMGLDVIGMVSGGRFRFVVDVFDFVILFC